MGSQGLLSLCLWIAVCGGVGCASPIGTDFITTFLQNAFPSYTQPRQELRITSHHDNTSVSISSSDGGFSRNLNLNSHRTISVQLPPSVEIRGSVIFSNTIRITSNKPINVLTLNYRSYSGETTIVYPLASLGMEYYLITPKNGYMGSPKVFSVVASKDETSVAVHLKGGLTFQNKNYPPNSVFTVVLKPFQGIQLLGSDDLSGSRVISQKPVAVLSGHSCAMANTRCSLTYEQLLPVSDWGTAFFVVPLSFQTKTDTVFVTASRPTQLTYVLGTSETNVVMVAGQVTQIEMSNVALRITASAAVQVTVFYTGGRVQRSEYSPMLMNIMDIYSYCSSYYVYGQSGTDNYAIVVAKKTSVDGITFEGGSPRVSRYNPIQGTDYVWYEYYYGNTLTSHLVAHSNVSFGLQSVGVGSFYSYGSMATCVKASEPVPPTVPPTTTPAPPSCSSITCPPRQECIMERGVPKCVPLKVNLCWASGDPHYRTFDGRYYDFMGTCTYTLVSVCGKFGGALPKFTVLAKNENRGNVRVSYVGQVSFLVNDHVIDVKKSEIGYVRVNKSRSSLPVSLINGTLRIFQSGNTVVIQYGNDVQVSYDWNHVAIVELSLRYAKAVCGMCGNYNQNPSDDFQTPDGPQANGVVAFGKSWKVEDNTTCWDDCHGPCLSCPPNMAEKYTTDAYCGLLDKTDGPFSQCHSIVNPKMYSENCVYDVCLNDGYKQFSCRALKAYADACQRQGLNISQWRDGAGCPFSCPSNSKYNSCGSACPATCQDPDASLLCTAPCIEGCECNPGFVLIQGKCLPIESCGCFFEGRSFSANETFWKDTKCQVKCTCNGRSQKVECKETSCRLGEECTVKGGLRDCYPISFGTCTVSGDPHYFTFDGLRYDFQGTCQYQLSALCNHSRDLTDFQVNVENRNRGDFRVSFASDVYVKVYGKEVQISMQQPHQVTIDGSLKHLPYSSTDGRISLYQNPRSAVLSTDFGLTVTFDWYSVVTVTIPGTYSGAVCGLCGNFNKDTVDDLTSRDESVLESAISIAQTWKVGGTSGCSEGGNPVCAGLEELQKKQRDGSTECGILLGREGPFRDCHKLVDPEPFFESCVYDYCILQSRQTVFCSVMSSYAQACQSAGGTVYPWRSDGFCSYICPANSHYEVCGNGCPVTCKDLIPPAGCQSTCREGCVCDAGFVLSGGSCVPISQCGCVYGGFYHPVGETIYTGENCEERCTCSQGGHMICSPSSCSINEECRQENGVLGCYPVGSAVCSASGDPHYRTFDGRAFDFQGVCQYVLTMSCGESFSETGRNLTDFVVITKNDHFGSSASLVSLVTVKVYGQTLTLIQSRRGIVQVNGADARLPVTLSSGKILVEVYGQGVLVRTDFGLVVTYDLSYHTTVRVPGNYRNQTCGLCGNYDSNPMNDVGLTSSDIIAFGEKWKTEEKCEAGCGSVENPCPTCPGPKMEVFSQNNYCGILSSTAGPFAPCQSVVDPAPFLNDCIYDLCQANGDTIMLCNNVAAYAAACKEAGVRNITWRTESFCDMKCSARSHYSQCADLCSSSCAALSGSYRCPGLCEEGCECDEGYLFDGARCVPLQECGCFQNGRYYKPNETVLNESCSSACTCNPISGLLCRNTVCNEEESCQIVDGVRSCINIDPCKSKTCRSMETCKVQDGKAICLPSFTGTCIAWGDPHYVTFDSYSFDFQGTCTYTLVNYTGGDSSLEPFHIEAKNENRGSQSVSYVRQINVMIYESKISIHVGEVGKIQVNGISTNLPFTLQGGKLKVSQSGSSAVLETDFGLVVKYDWNWYLVINLPSSYHNNVSGLCGNFNGDRGDEFLSPNNTQMASINEWAGSWRTDDGDQFCWDYCPGSCKSCEESKRHQYESENFCGLILKEDGPFSDCVTNISSKSFFDSCVHDVCLNDGAQVILCQALGVYASTCLKHGINVSDWRSPSACHKKCGENSHYEACGNACPATCSERNAPEQCEKPCVETCQCNDNFVLSVDKCVPISSCGCHFKGQYYEPHQEFWADDKCSGLCKCDPILGMVVCQQARCKASESCGVVNGRRGCYPIKYSTCTASNDPHYTTFDQHRFNFMGTCIYQMAGVVSNDSTLTSFTVNVQNDNRGNKAVSFTKDVLFEVYNYTITMSKDFPKKIKVNGILTELPYYYEATKIIAYTSGGHTFVKTDFDVTVSYDGNSYARVILPSAYAGVMTGLCGNNNQNPLDDFTVGEGIVAKTAEEFGNHWKVGEVPGCANHCPDCPVCTQQELEPYRSEKYCGLLSSTDGPFNLCSSVVDPKPYFEDCVFDTCHYKGHQTAYCNNIASYVFECQRNGVIIRDWRTPSFCPMTCPSNSHYELCGDGCPSTCYGLTSPRSCEKTCSEGCYCDSGFLLSGRECVPIGRCGCVFNGKYYGTGEEFYADGLCQKKCRCSNNGEAICQSNNCGPYEECRVVQGVLGCHASHFGQCTASGDPHFLTFDGVRYDFQGTCTYMLVRVDTNGTAFSVAVDHEPYGDGNVAVTKSVTVVIGDLAIRMERGGLGSVVINNERHNLPYQSTDGQVWLNQEGNNVILQSRIGLRLLFDRMYYVSVWVPSSFIGLTRGLCGNFNSDMSDDFQLPNGSLAMDPGHFGSSWAVARDGSDCSGCSAGKCPVCDPLQKELAKSPSKCGLLADPQGPFRGCHELLPPDGHVENCIYDVCAGNGGKDVLCMNLQAYAAECQSKGALLDTWRNATNCPLECPLNSHYELCTRTCGTTCYSISAPSSCTDRCFEGCECDAGYVSDGHKCVGLNNCGCAYRGRYLKAEEAFMSEDCQQNCTCRGGIVSCTESNCSANEICQLRGGLRGCYSRESECTISQQLHLTTFDGVSGDFPQEGGFVLSSSCNATAEGQFMVTMVGSRCNGEFKTGTALHVFTSQGLITVNGKRECWLNGWKLQPPTAIGDGSVQVQVSADKVTVTIVDQIAVVLGEEGEVTLTAKEKMSGEICGACGNFNRDAIDDLILNGGKAASSITHVIQSWAASYFSTCPT
ncbi:hypothetical protein XENTR_v10019689 [Xenopus tropicalis]|uniref:IgGFc-binding protein n=1 Tax=Xenopus tropicalis TaxID=8364 RepID=A0A8J1JT55_XENTR|nr:IgGFc-binding protein [Xenopus tropicalis]KAE8594554.1 hypothetical protein XENTR_v10019689 [Xenopus tropicalis]KAE8594555.1 hypothetical protein XENTR_v10019689 [Xenopus tropicalis]KAE8594556.1 hypothetical protein XENTR_v10019689 [Xenopus tropicalis]